MCSVLAETHYVFKCLSVFQKSDQYYCDIWSQFWDNWVILLLIKVVCGAALAFQQLGQCAALDALEQRSSEPTQNSQKMKRNRHIGINGKQPNIIMIMADDMGWNDIGYRCTSDVQTPFLDSLATKNGVILNRYYTAPMCGPSRAQLLSGMLWRN